MSHLMVGCSVLAIGFFLACPSMVRAGSTTAIADSGGVVEMAEVRGNSMAPLIKDGDKVRIQYGFYGTHEVKRGDIVTCRLSFRRDPIIKIVYAVPGDVFRLEKIKEDVQLLVNGSMVKNSAGQPYRFTGRRKRMLMLYERDYHGIIPQNAYLLLGNIPDGSLDSSSIGLIGRENIMGKAFPARLVGKK